MMYGYGYGGEGHWGAWVMMTLMMVAFWALVVLAVIALFRNTGSSRAADHRDVTDPLRLLDERLARGDIELADYEARRTALRGRGPTSG